MTLHRHIIHISWCLRLYRQGQVESVAARLYIKRRLNLSSMYRTNDQLFIIFKMATMGGDVMEKNYELGKSI